jgi:hypothetical protein
MNPIAITALVDWWRPETHSFHLQTAEMTVMLQDMAMILALPIEGKPLLTHLVGTGTRRSLILLGSAPRILSISRGKIEGLRRGYFQVDHIKI